MVWYKKWPEETKYVALRTRFRSFLKKKVLGLTLGTIVTVFQDICLLT